MFDVDKWHEIFLSLGRHKLRTFLTAFGVFWGIFLLLILLGVNKGLENGVYARFGGSLVNRFALWGGQTRIAHRGLNAGRSVELTLDDAYAIRDAIPRVEYVTATAGLWGEYTVSYRKKNGSFSVNGDLPEVFQMRHLTMRDGRFFNRRDVAEKRKVAVIGAKVASLLFEQETPVGKFLAIKHVNFLIIGVFDVSGIGNPQRATERIYLPLTTLQAAFSQGNRVWSIQVAVNPQTPVTQTEARAKALLRRRHFAAPDDEDAVGSWNASEEFDKLQALFRGVKTFMWIVGIGTILAGVIGVSNIMLIIVTERTKEIGIRKALGATPWSLTSLILQESIFLTGVAGYIGLVASVGMLEGATYLMERFGAQNEFFSHPEIDMRLALIASGILVAAGTLAGYFPARTAANINPIEALRSE